MSESNGTETDERHYTAMPKYDIKEGTENLNHYESMKKRVVLVDFWAEFCGPCKQMDREFKKLLEDETLSEDGMLVKVNVEQNPEIAKEYNIKSVPTLVMLNDGEVLGEMTGYKRYPEMKEVLEEAIESHLK